MNKRFLLTLSFLLMLMLFSSTGFAVGLGNVHFHSTNAYYNGNQLIVEGVLANTGNSTITGIHKFDLKIKDARGQLVADTTFAGGQLQNLVLNPGQLAPWTFSIDGARKGDLSKYTWDSHSEQAYQKQPQFTSGIHVFINNEMLQSDVAPALIHNRTLVPLRAVFEQLGAKVDWNDSTKTVTAVKGNTKITHQIGTRVLKVNGQAISLDVPSQTVKNRTMVPLRAVSESLGGIVLWGETGNAMTVVIIQ